MLQWRFCFIQGAIETQPLPLYKFTNHEEDCQARLNLPEDHNGFHTWDTPNPPPLRFLDAQQGSRTCFYGSPSVLTRFRTIDMTLITGLTFFFVYGTLYAIHGHTDTEPYASIPPEGLTQRLQAATT